MSHPCRIPKKYYDEVVESDPTLAKSNFPVAFERWLKKKAGKEAASPVSSESRGQGSPPSLAVAGEVTSPAAKLVTESVTYDWTQVPECPLRYEERNVCFYKKPGRKAIIEHVEPWMCQRCQYTLKINEKVAEIENKAIQERLRTSDWLQRHQLERVQQQEKPEEKPQQEEGPPLSEPEFIPTRLADLKRGPDGY